MPSMAHKLLSGAQAEIHGDEQMSCRTNASLNVQSLSGPSATVFGNLDIMDMVFDAFPGGYSGSLSRKQCLLRAALTSKDFFNPAMNVLWRSLDSLFPILNLIPNPKKCLSRTATNEDLSVMDDISEEVLIAQKTDQYRRRVRHLTLTGLAMKEHPSVADYISLFNRLPSDSEFTLFPCLQSLAAVDMNDFNWEDSLALFRIPSSTLSQVAFWGAGQGPKVYVETFLTRLSCMKAESLVALILQGWSTAKCLPVLQQFSNLRCLSFDLRNMEGLLDNLLKAITGVVNLRDLTLTHWCNESEAVVPFCSTELPLLDKLERLNLLGSSSFMCAVVGAISRYTPNLKTLSMNTWSSCAGDECLAMIERSFIDTNAYQCAASIECFLLEVDTEDGPFHWNALRFIKNWKSLKRLNIVADTVVVDSDGDQSYNRLVLPNGLDSLERLTLDVQHWRRLEQGKLCPATKHVFLAFPRIAECYPRLLLLSIYVPFPMDPAELEIMERALTLDDHQDPEHAVSSDAVPHGLEWLIFRQSFCTESASCKPSLKDAMIVARYLDDIFPQLEYVAFNAIVPLVGKRWCNTVARITGAEKYNWKE